MDNELRPVTNRRAPAHGQCIAAARLCFLPVRFVIIEIILLLLSSLACDERTRMYKVRRARVSRTFFFQTPVRYDNRLEKLPLSFEKFLETVKSKDEGGKK